MVAVVDILILSTRKPRSVLTIGIGRARVLTQAFRDLQSAETEEAGARLGCRGCLISLAAVVFIRSYVKM